MLTPAENPYPSEEQLARTAGLVQGSAEMARFDKRAQQVVNKV